MKLAAIEALISTGPAARRLDVSDEEMRRMIKRRDIPAIRTALGYLLDSRDVEDLRVKRGRKQHASATTN